MNYWREPAREIWRQGKEERRGDVGPILGDLTVAFTVFKSRR